MTHFNHDHPDSPLRRQLLLGAAAASVSFAGLSSCSKKAESNTQLLQVGGLPVTCNLTLPVACSAKAATNTAGTGDTRFAYEYSKYSG